MTREGFIYRVACHRHSFFTSGMKKSKWIQEFLASLPASTIDKRIVGYFVCFNRQEYYEAHDILEDLWLERGKKAGLFKGLIQLAGAFVHMQKHYLHPKHHIHGARLAPAGRLLDLAAANIGEKSSECFRIDLEMIRALITRTREPLQLGKNPWSPEVAPQLSLPNLIIDS